MTIRTVEQIERGGKLLLARSRHFMNVLILLAGLNPNG